MTTEEILNNEEKVMVRVEKDPLNPSIEENVYRINGVEIKIPLGKTVYVPKSVAELIERTR